MARHIFVYGTLKENRGSSHNFDGVREEVHNGKIAGAMYDINGNFPGVVPSPYETVYGEVHKYNEDHLEEVIKHMDMIEGYRGPKHPDNLYNREEVEVELESGEVVTANVYFFNRNIQKYDKVAEGVW